LGFYACHQEKPQAPVINVPDYQKAAAFFDRQNDSAFYYFNKVAGSSKDSLQVAMAYNWMGEIQSDAGDYFGSQESLSTSLKFLDDQKTKNYRCLTADYNELGVTSLNLKNYDAAIGFYDQAFKFTDQSETKATILNNQANAYQKKKDYKRALKLYRAAIILTGTKGAGYARILTNMAFTQWLKQPGYNAAPELLQALGIRLREQDRWGQNASYAHLADYYTRSKPDSALHYAREMYTTATRINSPDDRIEALQKLIGLGTPQDARQYFALYQALDDSLQTARNAAKNQFALIRYNSEKNKADNLKLQKDNAEGKYQLIRQSILFYSTLFLLVAGTVIAIIWYRKRKIRLQLEAENTIRESQLKTSQKVHDVVANGLYVIMTEVENEAEVHKENLLDRIEVLYEKSRDISYEEISYPEQAFPAQIANLLKSFATAGTRVVLSGNTETLWKNVTGTAKRELEHILQELMVNMKKHSRAGNVGIKFEQQDDRITITYTDDGIGLTADIQHKNGLKNTGNRIKAIRGAISFAGNGASGLRIQISFPIA
jgi:signal transduction histidine kinase